MSHYLEIFVHNKKNNLKINIFKIILKVLNQKKKHMLLVQKSKLCNLELLNHIKWAAWSCYLNFSPMNHLITSFSPTKPGINLTLILWFTVMEVGILFLTPVLGPLMYGTNITL